MTPAVTTQWRPLPSLFADRLRAHVAQAQPKAISQSHRVVREIHGSPWPLEVLPPGQAPHGGFYARQFQRLERIRNSAQPTGPIDRHDLSRLQGTLTSYLQNHGLFQKGWRARSIMAHPEDGKPRLWITRRVTQ